MRRRTVNAWQKCKCSLVLRKQRKRKPYLLFMNSLSRSHNANTAALAQQLLTMITSQNSPKTMSKTLIILCRQKFLIKVKLLKLLASLLCSLVAFNFFLSMASLELFTAAWTYHTESCHCNYQVPLEKSISCWIIVANSFWFIAYQVKRLTDHPLGKFH